MKAMGDLIANPVRGQAKADAGLTAAPPTPDTGFRREQLGPLGWIFAQVALVALIMRQFGLEPLAFRRAVYIAAVGFVVNHLLPRHLRPRFFAALSVGALVVILGGAIDSRAPQLGLGLLRSGTLLAGGVLLMSICHLRLGFWKRAGLLVAAGGVLAVARAGFLPSGPVAVVWPVLAGMFMFRVMVYLYDRATAAPRGPLSHTVSYFFLFPNASALLFPVIDFRTFTQKYYDEEALAIYQRGARWMARGVLHLLLYRVVDRLLMLEPASVSNGAELVQFVVSNLFLYLKVSGVFHLAVGMLLLFGFNLPETNHRYFLAASFTDYWRRVNIYWRNFIMKVFYYPAYFRCKHLGQTRALTLATLWSFAVTWTLHLYQTWWIKGAVAWSWPDTLFWSALALLVLGNSLWELKRNRQRKLASGTYTMREAAGLALRTAGTFTVIAVLWSLWSAPSVGEWLKLWGHADAATLAWGALVLGCVMVAAIVCEVLPQWRKRTAAGGPRAEQARFYREALACALPLAALYVAALPAVQARVATVNSTAAVELIGMFRLVTDDDSARGQGRGYYENLTAPDEGSGQYFAVLHPGQGLRYMQPTREVPGQHFGELAPNVQFKHHDWSFATNRWGMRDRDYELAKPAGTVRIALLGSSQVMGFGLADQDLFAVQIEERLNAEQREHGRFEVLNFAVGGLSPLGQTWLLPARAGRFAPDVVVFVAHSNDYEWTARDVARVTRKRLALPSTFPAELLARARVTSRTPEAFAVTRLRPFETELLAGCYHAIVAQCRQLGAMPVLVFLPVPMDLPLDAEKVGAQLRLAKEAGFTVIDLAAVFDGHEAEKVMLRDNGRHINAAGNALIARALLERLIAEPEIDLLNRAKRRAEPTSGSNGSAARP